MEPSLGGKVVSLKDVVTGSGWDEMFPTVDACHLQNAPWTGTEPPNNGEVWSLPWQCGRLEDDRLHCAVEGRASLYDPASVERGANCDNCMKKVSITLKEDALEKLKTFFQSSSDDEAIQLSISHMLNQMIYNSLLDLEVNVKWGRRFG